MWLWSLTWCAKWQALNHRPVDSQRQGEDWAGELSEAALIRHVAERTRHYLEPQTIKFVIEEWRKLASIGL